MGASQSHFQQPTRMESSEQDNDVPPLQPAPENKIAPYVPPRPPPTMKRIETFEEKAYRKVSIIVILINSALAAIAKEFRRELRMQTMI